MPIINKQLQKKIISMIKTDQAARKLAVANSKNKNICNKVYKIDCKNQLVLKEIINEFGWPTFSMVGKRASNNFCLLVQHADTDLQFQKKCLKLLTISAKKNQAKLSNVAYLSDRVRAAEGKKIKFGTQYLIKNGKLEMKPVANLKELAQLRRNYGLPTIKKQNLKMKRLYAKLLKANKEQKS